MKKNVKTGLESKIVLLGIPFDENSSFLKGPAKAPSLIREALHSPSSNLWTETGIDLGQKGLIHDAGDLSFSSSDDAFLMIERSVSSLLEKKIPVISLGGDHSVTHPVISAYYQNYGSVHLLHLDAHPDLYDRLDGSGSSHACPFARIMEEGLAGRLVQAGIRTLNGHQKVQAERFGTEIIPMNAWKDNLELHFDQPLYISIDIDVMDPAFAPGVSHFEPGGLSVRQMIDLLYKIQAPSIIGADIVEFNPDRDSSGRTAMVCAKLLKELAGLMSKYK